jgi:hypothetical protein
MNPTNQPKANPPPLGIMMWVLWFAMLAGVSVVIFFLGGGLPTGKNAPGVDISPVFWACVVPLFMATMLRWLVLPRFTALNKIFVGMILGLSFSEGAIMIGIFLLPGNQPETKLLLIGLGLASMLQYAPIYARGPDAQTRRP